MNTEQAKAFLERYNEGTASSEEQAFVESWLLSYPLDNRNLLDQELKEADLAEIRANLVLLSNPVAVRKKLWPRIAVAAAAVAAIVFGVWFYNSDKILRGALDDKSVEANDIAPGGNKATIKIGDGEVITLSDKQSGVIVNANQVTYDDGSSVLSSRATPLSSRAPSLSSRANAKDLTITTPRGGTYQVTLSDGTKVWLNAASSITYSASLNERGLRRVRLEGEGYFEVAKNKNKPFIVETRGQEVEVLGTHFNVNAYKDEGGVKTTLLEGSVRVSAPHRPSATSPRGGEGLHGGYGQGGQGYGGEQGGDGYGGEAIVLKPRQQAVLAGQAFKVKEVDVNDIVAWKNGDFVFRNERLEDIMKDVQRWYNIDVLYTDESLKDIRLGGFVSRTKNISAVLRLMTLTRRVNFKVEGKTVTVLP